MKEYHIIGVGRIGYPLAKELLLQKPNVKLHLWDPDTIKPHNKTFLRSYTNELKTITACKTLKGNIIPHNEYASNDNLKQFNNKFVIDCSDTKSIFKTNADIKISYDGPILSISDGKLHFEKSEVPFYYPYDKVIIQNATQFIIKILKSPFNYKSTHRLYIYEKQNWKLVYNKKSGKMKTRRIKNITVMIPDSSQFNECFHKFEKPSFNITYFDIDDMKYKKYIFEQKSSTKILSDIYDNINLKNSFRYYLSLDKVDMTNGAIYTHLYHHPTGC